MRYSTHVWFFTYLAPSVALSFSPKIISCEKWIDVFWIFTYFRYQKLTILRADFLFPSSTEKYYIGFYSRMIYYLKGSSMGFYNKTITHYATERASQLRVSKTGLTHKSQCCPDIETSQLICSKSIDWFLYEGNTDT